MSVSLGRDDDAVLRGYWDQFAVGATIGVPLKKAPWGDSFGMLRDKFGTPWMVNIAGTRPTHATSRAARPDDVVSAHTTGAPGLRMAT